MKLYIPKLSESVEFKEVRAAETDFILFLKRELEKNPKTLLKVGEEKFVYLKDLRINYVDRELYFEVVYFDSLECGLSYNYRLGKFLIYSEKEGFNDVEISLVNFDEELLEIYNFRNSRLDLEISKDVNILFDKYLRYSYGKIEEIEKEFRYSKIDRRILSTEEKKVFGDKGLNFYKIYDKNNFTEKVKKYRDVRRWDLEDIKEELPDFDLHENIFYDLRRIDFELDLFVGLIKGIKWTNFSHGDLSMLTNGRRKFIKHKRGKLYMIFKREWFK